METVAFPPKFKQPNLQSFDGRGSPRQHICHFKALTGGIAGNDALMIRLFVSTLRDTAFDWYARLPAGTINSWADEQFACDDEVTNEVVVNFYVLRAGMEDRIGRQVVALALYSAG